jgi:protein involved in polysaccharide export with SLBB domain
MTRCLPLLVLVLSTPVKVWGQQSTPPAAYLHPGDLLRVTVYGRPELSGDLDIAADSTLRHPLYRNVKVAGVPLSTVEERIRTLLRTFEADPKFVLDPLYHVAVGGEVREPKLLTLRPEVTIGQAIALAGGPNERGRVDRVRILRGDGEFMLDLTKSDVERVRSGDRIIVTKKGASFFRDVLLPLVSVTGAVAAVYVAIKR